MFIVTSLPQSQTVFNSYPSKVPKKWILQLGKPFHDTSSESSDQEFLCGVALLVELELPQSNTLRFICVWRPMKQQSPVNLLELLF